MYKSINVKIKYTLTIASIFLIANSCRSTDTDNNFSGSNLSGVSFNLTDGDFDESDILASQASLKTSVVVPEVLRQEIASGPFNIIAELSPEIPSAKLMTQASATQGSIAVNKPLSLRGGVKYRVIAYQADGTYIDQAIGDASQTNQIFFADKLTKGQIYNFVIYSLGNTIDNPPVVPKVNLNSDPSNSFSFLGSYLTNTADLMWAVERNVKILGDPGDATSPTSLNTPLKHIFTRVNVSVDNSDAIGSQKGGYLSEKNVSATIMSPQLYSASTFNFNTGTITGGSVNSSGILTGDVNAAIQTYIVNTSGVANSTVSISVPAGAIKVGNDINPTSVTFSFSSAGGGLKPGYSYTLKLRFNSDRYVNSSNITRNTNDSDALYAIIGGYRWDRYNLGVININPASNNPDQNPSLQALYGNFYQWGYKTVAATSYSGDGAISGWNTTPALDKSWNSSTETNPIKTLADPCSSGSRIPTLTEFNTLTNNTLHTSIGNWTSFSGSSSIGLSDYTAAHVMTSKKNGNVKLTFPAAGWRALSSGAQVDRQAGGLYWSSTEIQGNSQARYIRLFVNGSWDTTGYGRTAGESLRCIQDK
ncbi:fimbrillin family protein [Elizabethkingia ursingii]|uniref:fimbrillin family protein n=1 Tax=Elizabethkingia ursingii TaxID=1756150 RepID=UPI001FD27F3C|nr:fimbrillin family protein [Elizabethkingia ursingii]